MKPKFICWTRNQTSLKVFSPGRTKYYFRAESSPCSAPLYQNGLWYKAELPQEELKTENSRDITSCWHLPVHPYMVQNSLIGWHIKFTDAKSWRDSWYSERQQCKQKPEEAHSSAPGQNRCALGTGWEVTGSTRALLERAWGLWWALSWTWISNEFPPEMK